MPRPVRPAVLLLFTMAAVWSTLAASAIGADLAAAAAPPFPRRPTTLAVPGHQPAEFVGPDAPAGSTRAFPVVVVLHGNFDRPEWECEEWDRIVGGRAWLLCTRGVGRKDAPGMDRWTYPSRKYARAEIDAAIEALRARFGPHVDAASPLVYGGFSLGAIYGEAIARAEPTRFPRVVLIEGGRAGWTAAAIAAFAKKGGKGVLFGCGSKGCGKNAEALAAKVRAAGLVSGVGTDARIGHSYGGEIPTLLRRHFDEMVKDAPGWGL